MVQLNIDDLRRAIVKRYAIALLLVALLSTFAFVVLTQVLKGSDDTAYVVNISGKQRMLSQVIVLDAYRLQDLRRASGTLDKKSFETSELIEHIKEHIDEMERVNLELSTGKISENEIHPLSKEMKNLYFGSPHLSVEVVNYLDLAREFLEADSLASSDEILMAMSSISRPLLQNLDEAVRLYQKEGETKLENIARMEFIVWMATLFVLLLEVIFIFQPMVRKIIKLANSRNANIQELEHMVELRTLNLEKANQQLMNLAYHDPLTGLRNRLNLEQDVEKTIESYKKHQAPFAIFMLDIDWFKKVNDEHGHDVGDFVLKELSQLLRDFVRYEDAVYRAGGEEFVILFERIGLEEALNKAEHIRQGIEDYAFETKGISLRKTISIGVYHSSIYDEHSVKDVLKRVDDALYRSKSLGRNKVTLASNNLQKEGAYDDAVKYSLLFGEKALTGDLHEGKQTLVPFKVTPGIEALLGVSADAIATQQAILMDLFHPDDQDICKKILKYWQNARDASRSQREGLLPWKTTVRLVLGREEVKILKMTVRVSQFLKDENPWVVEVCLQDTLPLSKAFGDELLVYNFHAMMENTNDYIYFKDSNHVFTAASKTLVDLTNVNHRSELVGKNDYQVFPKEYADQYFILEKQVFSGDVHVAQEFQPTLDKNGISGWVDNRKYPIKNEKDEIIGLFGIARVISEDDYQKLLAEKKALEHLAPKKSQ